MTEELKELKELYEAVADKTLSFGCKVLYNFQSKDMWDESTVWKYISYNWDYYSIQSPYWKHGLKGWFEILWHDIHIGHCYAWLKEQEFYYDTCWECCMPDVLNKLYKNKRENIEHPDNKEALAYMSNLISNK